MSDRGKLNHLKVAGFKSIERLDLELKDLNILIGANGAGKSNFIGLFKLLHEILLKNLQFYVSQQLGADKLLFFGGKRTEAINIRLEFWPNAYRVVLAPDAAGGLVFKQEFCRFLSGTPERRSEYHYGLARPGAHESGLPDEPNVRTAPGHVADYLRNWKVYHFHDTSESAKVKQPGRIRETDALLPQAENLAAFLRSIRKRQAYQLIVQTVQRVAPFFQEFVLEPESDNPQAIRLRWRHRGSDDTFDASDFSDGTLRFICLTTLLLQPEPPATILLDEPELGLHPYALQILAGMMRTASSRTQIVASTQSVTLANQFSWEDLIVVDRVTDASNFRRLTAEDLEQWFNDYAIGELWEKNVIGGTP